MEEKLQQGENEKKFIDQLSKGNFNKAHLRNISKSIAGLFRSGFQVIDGSQFGKPAFEKLMIDTHLPFENASFLQKLLDLKDLKEMLVYREGIPPMPDFYNVKVTIEDV